MSGTTGRNPSRLGGIPAQVMARWKPGLTNLKKGILMTDLKRRSLVAALGAAPFAVPLLGHAQAPDSNPRFKQIPSRERTRQRYFPNLVLTDQNGRKLKFYDDLVKDKIVIFNMFYAQCEGICTPITRNLVRLQNILGSRVGKDIFMYSFTLKPKEDTVSALKHYAQMHKVKPGWLFLTGLGGRHGDVAAQTRLCRSRSRSR